MKSIIRHTVLFLVTGCYAGLSPKMPGTVGTIAAALLQYWLFPNTLREGYGFLAAVVLFCVLAVVISELALRIGLFESGKDPQQIVIDEYAGLYVALIGFELSWVNIALAVVLFRVFDIWKPGPVRLAEKLPGGLGIVADDIVAGIIANAFLWIILLGSAYA